MYLPVVVCCLLIVALGHVLGVSGQFQAFTEEVFAKQKYTETVRFVGDVMLARNVETLMDIYGNMYPFSRVNFGTDSTYMVGNFEGVVPQQHIHTPNFAFAFSVPNTSIPTLSSFWFTHMSLANNHAYDFGAENYRHTQEVLQKNDIASFGNPQKLGTSSVSFISLDGMKVAVIGIHTLFSPITPEDISGVMVFANEHSDVQIAYIHWGEEYVQTHSTNQERVARILVDSGVDVIIGHHPHVVQDIAKYKDAVIFYSLGNFIFDQYFSDAVQQGLVLEMAHTKNTLSFTLLPVTSIDAYSAPRLMDEYEKKLFLEGLAKNSDLQLGDEIRAEVISIDKGTK